MGVVSKIGKNLQEKIWVGYLPTPYHPKPHQYQPFKKVLSLSNLTNPAPNLTPTKIPTIIEISTHINLAPNRPKSRTPKLPKTPK